MHVCNACWREVVDGDAYVARCGHQFCAEDARKAQHTGECPHCQSVLYADKDIRRVPLRPTEEHVATLLTGLDPRAVLTAAFAGVQFWCEQQELVASTYQQHIRDTAARHEEAYKAKLQEVHAAYKKAKQKQQDLWERVQSLEMDNKELHSKYEQKSSEKRKLEAQLREMQTRGGGGPGGAQVAQVAPTRGAFRRSPPDGGDVAPRRDAAFHPARAFEDRIARADAPSSRRSSGAWRSPLESPGRSLGGRDPLHTPSPFGRASAGGATPPMGARPPMLAGFPAAAGSRPTSPHLLRDPRVGGPHHPQRASPRGGGASAARFPAAAGPRPRSGSVFSVGP